MVLAHGKSIVPGATKYFITLVLMLLMQVYLEHCWQRILFFFFWYIVLARDVYSWISISSCCTLKSCARISGMALKNNFIQHGALWNGRHKCGASVTDSSYYLALKRSRARRCGWLPCSYCITLLTFKPQSTSVCLPFLNAQE